MPVAWALSLVPPNCKIRVEVLATGRDASGAPTTTWATLLASASALLSQVQGGRPGDWGGTPNVLTGSLTGFDPELGRADVRGVVTSGFLAGRTIYPVQVETHPGGVLVDPRIRWQWSTVQPTT